MSAHKLRLEIAPRAQQDIRNIRLFGLQHWDEHRANIYLAAITARFEIIHDNPELGIARGDLVPGLRAHRVERHVIFYRIREDVIEIIRVLHERQDVISAVREE